MSEGIASKAGVKQTKEEFERQRRAELKDVSALMEMPEFRRLAARLVTKCGVMRSIMEMSSRIYYNAGQQDLGHWFSAELESANQEAYFTMLREEKQRREKEGV